MKMYILIKESVPTGFAVLAAASRINCDVLTASFAAYPETSMPSLAASVLTLLTRGR